MWKIHDSVFGVISAMVWLVVDFAWGRQRRAEQRLGQLRPVGGRLDPVDSEDASTTGAVSDWFGRATPQLAKPLQPP